MAEPPAGSDLLAQAIAAAGSGERRFAAPWQARAFATVLALQQAGALDRNDWAARLGRAIRAAQERGDPDLGDTYYDHFATALEEVLRDLGMVDPALHRADADALLAHRAEHRHGLPEVPGRPGHSHGGHGHEGHSHEGHGHD